MIPVRRDDRFERPSERVRNPRRRGAAVSNFLNTISGLLKPPALVGAASQDPAVGRSAFDHKDIGLGFLIHDVSRLRRNAYDQFAKPLGITRAQWWALAHLSQHDGMMQTQLADVLEVGKSSLGDLVESLEAGAWVERRADPVDRRVRHVFLMPAALALIERMTLMEAQFNDQILGQLSPPERSELSRMLLTVKHAISRFDPVADIHSAV